MVIEIGAVPIARMRNAVHLRYSKDFLAIVERNDPAVLNVVEKFTRFRQITQAIEDLYKSESGSLITPEMIAFDESRDNCVNGLRYVVLGYTYHHDPATKKAAEALLQNMDNYGTGIARESYQAETTIIEGIVQDWTTKPLLIDAVTRLNLKPWLDKMAEDNNRLNTLFLDRTQEMGNMSPDTIKAKRLESNEAYYELRKRINSNTDIAEGANPFGKTVNELNALIDQYNNLLARTQGGADDEEPTGGEGGTPTTPA